MRTSGKALRAMTVLCVGGVSIHLLIQSINKLTPLSLSAQIQDDVEKKQVTFGLRFFLYQQFPQAEAQENRGLGKKHPLLPTTSC